MDSIFEIEWRQGQQTFRTELQAACPTKALQILAFYIESWDEMHLLSTKPAVKKRLDFWADWN